MLELTLDGKPARPDRLPEYLPLGITVGRLTEMWKDNRVSAC